MTNNKDQNNATDDNDHKDTETNTTTNVIQTMKQNFTSQQTSVYYHYKIPDKVPTYADCKHDIRKYLALCIKHSIYERVPEHDYIFTVYRNVGQDPKCRELEEYIEQENLTDKKIPWATKVKKLETRFLSTTAVQIARLNYDSFKYDENNTLDQNKLAYTEILIAAEEDKNEIRNISKFMNSLPSNIKNKIKNHLPKHQINSWKELCDMFEAAELAEKFVNGNENLNETGSETILATTSSTSPNLSNVRDPCFFFFKGYCRNGAKCSRSHRDEDVVAVFKLGLNEFRKLKTSSVNNNNNNKFNNTTQKSFNNKQH